MIFENNADGVSAGNIVRFLSANLQICENPS